MTFLINICIPLVILSLTATKQIIMSRIALDSNILIYNHSLDCENLYSEDMHDGQIIENMLKIKNPFI